MKNKIRQLFHRIRCQWPLFRTIVEKLIRILIFILIVLLLGCVFRGCCIESEERKKTELEIRHILVEGDQRGIDIEKIDEIESCGFVVRKIVVSDKMMTFYMERKNGKYLWIYDKSHRKDVSVVPLIDDLPY